MEFARYLRPAGLPGVEALHASFVTHRYRPHSHPTWTVATVRRGAARFALEDTEQRAGSGELFVLEPDAVHTGVPAVPGGWAYQVLYLDPAVIPAWAEEGGPPRAARWVVFRDETLRRSLAVAHRALAGEPPGLAVDEAVLAAVDALRPHLAPGPPVRARRSRPAVAAVSRFELARTFRAQVGLPPHAFQLDLRVARARALLAAGEPAAAVAAQCGFYDQAHLTRVFKQAVGVPPARYARSSKT